MIALVKLTFFQISQITVSKIHQEKAAKPLDVQKE